MIACVYIPHFIAAVHQHGKGAVDDGRLVVFEPDSRFRTVVGTSHQAAQAGARIGMTLRQVQAKCGELRAIPINTVTTRRTFDHLLATLASFTPQVEPEQRIKVRRNSTKQAMITGDEDAAVIYIELGKLTVKQGYDVGNSITGTIVRETHLKSAVALSSGKFTSRVIASSLVPGKVTVIPLHREAQALAAFPATLLPIYSEEVSRLLLLGLTTLGQVAALTHADMFTIFGKQGRKMHSLAKGRDSSPVLEYASPPKECAATQLDPPVEDSRIIENNLRSLSEGLSYRLERESKVAQEIEVALVFENGASRSKDVTLRQPTRSADHLTRSAIDLLATIRVPSRITEIEMTLFGLQTTEAKQLNMFELEGVSQDRLPTILKNAMARYGDALYTVDVIDPHPLLLKRGFKLRRADE